MTKHVFIAAVIVSFGMFLCPLNTQHISKNVPVSEFSSITLESVGNIVFTQSSGYGCRIEGPKEYVDKTRITLKNRKLTISYKEKHVKNGKKLMFYITSSELTKVELEGVGNFSADGTLKLKKVDFELDGVGNCTVKA